MDCNHVLYRLLSHQKSLIPQTVDDMLSCFSYGHAADIGYIGSNRSVRQNDFFIRQMVFLTPVHVCRIPESSTHNRAGSFFHGNGLIGQNENLKII